MIKKFVMCDYKMSFNERRMTIGICIIFIFRMLGMFMVTPAMNTSKIFTGDINKLLIGCAIGIYGLMQVIFQIPFGYIANKYGYKKTISLGLFIFFIGSVISSYSNSIYIFIFGRGLQGSAAISSVSLAFLTSCIREENYTKSIACVGISFGFSFLISIIFGPFIVSNIGLNGLFIMISILSLFSIFIFLYFLFPYYSPLVFKKKNITLYNILYIFKSYDIIGYLISVFCLHLLLTINFIIIPKDMELLGYILYQHSKIYSIIIVLSLFFSTPIILYSERKFYVRLIMLISIFFFIISEFIFLFYNKFFLFFLIGMEFFFISFILSESFLPSLLSKISPLEYKSIIMSVYSTSQFLGMAIGGLVGGFIYHVFSLNILCILGIFISIFWFLIFYFISPPIYILTLYFHMNKKVIYDIKLKNRLQSFPGIIFFKYLKKEHILYIKINSQIMNKKKLEYIINNES